MVSDQGVHDFRRPAVLLAGDLGLQDVDGFPNRRSELRLQEIERNAPLPLFDASVRSDSERGQRRYVEDVRFSAELRVVGQGDTPLVHQLVDRRVGVVAVAHEDGAARALPHAGGRHPLFETREAADAVLPDAANLVEVDLLVRAGSRAGLVALALTFVSQDDAEVVAFVERPPRTRLHTGRLGAMVADPRHVVEIGVREFAGALVLVPVHGPVGFAIFRLQADVVRGGVDFFPVVLGSGSAAELLGSRVLPEHHLAVLVVTTAHLLPVAGGAAPRQRVHTAPPLLVGPRLVLMPEHLAGHRAGLTANAFVQIENHCNLPTHAVSLFSAPTFVMSTRVSRVT